VFAHDTLDAATIEGPCDVVLAMFRTAQACARSHRALTRARPGTPVIAMSADILAPQQVRDRRARAELGAAAVLVQTIHPRGTPRRNQPGRHPERTMVTAKGEHEPKFPVRRHESPAAWKAASSALLPYIVLAVSLATTGLWWYVLHVQSTARARTEFENEAHQSANEIREALVGIRGSAAGRRRVLLASDTVSSRRVASLCRRLRSDATYPGIEAVNYGNDCNGPELRPLEARMRQKGTQISRCGQRPR